MRVLDVDENIKVDLECLKSSISHKTALVALSAPNWPFGTIDPVEEVAEIAGERGIPVHIDACLGGFILPFFERIGEKVEPFDFRVEGVTSISLDVHKYGYSPKGASVILFRSEDLKKESIFVDTSNPGYVFINPAVLSSRSLGPLAAAFATITYLGEEGYMRFARDILIARETLYKGLKSLGFESVAPIESSILSLYSKDVDLVSFVTAMREMGWHFHLQRSVKKYGIPQNIHLTLSPIHKLTAGEFLKDAEKAVAIKRRLELKKLSPEQVFERVKAGKFDSSLAPLLLDQFEPEVADEVVKSLVIEIYR